MYYFWSSLYAMFTSTCFLHRSRMTGVRYRYDDLVGYALSIDEYEVEYDSGLQIGLSPAIFGPFLGYQAKLFTRVILGPAQRNYIEKGTLPPKSAPQNKIGLKFLLQKVEIFRRQPSPVSIGLSPICNPATIDSTSRGTATSSYGTRHPVLMALYDALAAQNNGLSK